MYVFYNEFYEQCLISCKTQPDFRLQFQDLHVGYKSIPIAYDVTQQDVFKNCYVSY